MPLTPVFLDFETYWSTDHSLTKMNPIAYVMHPDTEIISVSVKVGNYNTDVIFGEEAVKKALKKMNWDDKIAIAHNMSRFDSMILAWRCGIHPKMWGCTLAMAKPHHAKTAGGSLKALVELYGLGVKDATALIQTKGKHLKDFTPEEISNMKIYNAEDTELCAKLFHVLGKKTLPKEMVQIDHTIRMLVNPGFTLNTELLNKGLALEKQQKREQLTALAELLYTPAEIAAARLSEGEDAEEMVRAALASAPKFSEVLEKRGVPVPMKQSPTNPDKMVPALAKTDEEFIALQEHDDPVVAAAACARLAIKSTLLETRIGAFLEASAAAGGRLPIPLVYYGGHTGRWSGWGYNPQNLPRILKKRRISDVLRVSMCAPKGYKVVVSDLSGIEMRINHFLWKVPSSMELFMADPEKADLYKDFASSLYGVSFAAVDSAQRQIGKVAHLGLGFQAGWSTFIRIAKTMGGVDMEEEMSKMIVNKWRQEYKEIVQGWGRCDAALEYAESGDTFDIDPWGMCRTEQDGILLPSGRRLEYPKLRRGVDKNERAVWKFGEGRHLTFLSGGKVCENCIAEGTLVLTPTGWKPIESIELTDSVHDGNTFVPHEGKVLKSVQPCVIVDGVHMTADHEVLTNEGWKMAGENPKPYRPAVRSTDRLTPGGHRRASCEVEVPVRLRETGSEGRNRRYQRGKAGGNSELRVHDSAAYFYQEPNPWHGASSGVWSLSKHGRPLSTAFSSSVEKLRRARDSCVLAMAGVVRELLGRYGGRVFSWVGFGPHGQQRPLFPGELPVGFSPHKYYEPEGFCSSSGRTRVVGAVRDKHVNAVLSREARVACGGLSPSAESYKQVFDIKNAGPQHRFVVLGDTGPFIVHNCVQAIGRDILAEYSAEITRQTGVYPTLLVHDERVDIVKEEKAEEHLNIMNTIMRTPPVWWPELAVWSEGGIGDNYGAAK